MQKVIISTTSGWQSSRRWFEAVGEKDTILDQHVRVRGEDTNKRFLNGSTKDFQTISSFKYRDPKSIVIRFGTTLSIHPRGECIVYNKSDAISLASNKMKARMVMNAAGVPTPRIIEDGNPSGIYPIIARKDFTERGEGLHIIQDRHAYNLAREAGYCYMSELYPRTKEYRVHCAHGKVLAIYEKPMPENTADIHECIRHFNDEDWGGAEYYRDYDAEICRVALDAVKALGLDFGGVDVMAFPSDKKFPRQVVCEVNTAPTLITEYILMRYSLYANWLFSEFKRKPHFDYTKLKNGRDFAWTKEELQS